MGSRISFAAILCVVLSVSVHRQHHRRGDVASYQDRYFEQLIFGASPDELTQILTIYEDRRQRSIAECMRNDGFEYTPLKRTKCFNPLAWTSLLEPVGPKWDSVFRQYRTFCRWPRSTIRTYPI